jgi:hypothetical protein
MEDIKVTHKNLGKERAWGTANLDNNKIELDHRLKGKKHLEILIHEVLHIQNPEMSETQVIKRSKQITKILWEHKYRRIDDQEKQKG